MNEPLEGLDVDENNIKMDLGETEWSYGLDSSGS